MYLWILTCNCLYLINYSFIVSLKSDNWNFCYTKVLISFVCSLQCKYWIVQFKFRDNKHTTIYNIYHRQSNFNFTHKTTFYYYFWMSLSKHLNPTTKHLTHENWTHLIIWNNFTNITLFIITNQTSSTLLIIFTTPFDITHVILKHHDNTFSTTPLLQTTQITL